MATVEQLFVYPLKSGAGVQVPQHPLNAFGFAYDRHFLVVDEHGKSVTQRQRPKLATISLNPSSWAYGDADVTWSLSAMGTTFAQGKCPPRDGAQTITVDVWQDLMDGALMPDSFHAAVNHILGTENLRVVCHTATSKRLASAKRTHEHEVPITFPDSLPILVTSVESLAQVNAWIEADGGKAVPMDRFRPNLVISGVAPFEEDTCERIQAGDVVLRRAKQCGRCKITTIDQATGMLTGAEPLKTLGKHRKFDGGVMFGSYYYIENAGAGIISVGACSVS